MKAFVFFVMGMMFGLAHAQSSLESYISRVCKSPCADISKVVAAVDMAATVYGLDKAMLLAIIHTESTFNKRAKNGSSVGLMQVHIRYHLPKFEGHNLYGEFANIFAGARILKDCSERKGQKRSVDKTLSCYNGGGTKGYAAKVQRKMKQFRPMVSVY